MFVTSGGASGINAGLIAYNDNGVANTGTGFIELMESQFGKYRTITPTSVTQFVLRNGQQTSTMLSTTKS